METSHAKNTTLSTSFWEPYTPLQKILTPQNAKTPKSFKSSYFLAPKHTPAGYTPEDEWLLHLIPWSFASDHFPSFQLKNVVMAVGEPFPPFIFQGVVFQQLHSQKPETIGCHAFLSIDFPKALPGARST